MNYGTAVNSPNGGLNGTVGGTATNGVASFTNNASNQPVFIKDTNLGGSSKDSLVSSLNPTTVQNDSINDRTSQYVARTAQYLVSGSLSGYHTDFPTATNVADQTIAARSGPAYLIEGNTYPNSIGKVGAGLQETPVLGATNNLASAQYQTYLAINDTVTGQNGALPIGSPTPQVRNESEDGGVTSTNFLTRTTNTASANTAAEAPVTNGLNPQFTDVQVG